MTGLSYGLIAHRLRPVQSSVCQTEARLRQLSENSNHIPLSIKALQNTHLSFCATFYDKAAHECSKVVVKSRQKEAVQPKATWGRKRHLVARHHATDSPTGPVHGPQNTETT